MEHVEKIRGENLYDHQCSHGCQRKGQFTIIIIVVIIITGIIIILIIIINGNSSSTTTTKILAAETFHWTVYIILRLFINFCLSSMKTECISILVDVNLKMQTIITQHLIFWLLSLHLFYQNFGPIFQLLMQTFYTFSLV